MIQRYSLPEIARIWADENKFKIWLDIEIYAAEANSILGIVPKSALKKIKSRAKFNIEKINKIESVVKHDVIAFLTNVASYVGHDSRFIHYGMTSSDVLDTALSVQAKQASVLILNQLLKLKSALSKKAKKYKYLLMVGRTHGVHAEAITLGLKFAVWVDEINRNINRLKSAIKSVSIGKISGAVGTYEHINPFVEKYVCRKLGLKPANSATQIIQRDLHAELISVYAIIASSLDKFATEIRHLQKTETLELEEPFTKGQKGSSAMPHKKNPVTCEQISGLARVIRSSSVAALENINLWHERDISHSSVERIIIPDSSMLLYYMIVKMIFVIEGLVVNKNNINKNLQLTHGLIYSQRVLLKLVELGLTREQAYKAVQDNAMWAWKTQQDFQELLQNDPIIAKKIPKSKISEIFNPESVFKNIDFIFKKVGIK
jgi:adenylosuccinate lyase